MSNESRLTEYCLGLLQPRRRRRLDDELAVSPRLRAELRRLQQSLEPLAALDPRPPRDAVRARLLSSLTPTRRFSGFRDRLCRFLDLPAAAVDALLDAAMAAPDAPGWRPLAVRGLFAYPFTAGPNVADADARFLYLAPGCRFPQHRHRGKEWGFIVQGDIVEDSGHRYTAGDIVYQAIDSAHSFYADGEQPTLLVVLLEGGIEWRDDD